jgi:surface carbohydrate biosynthesis protein
LKYPIVYLPVEIRSREFESKALLAALLAERGFPVVLGQLWMMYANFDRLPAGVILSKSFNKIHHPSLLQAKRAGHRIVALEEEMLAQVEDKAVAYLCAAGIFGIADLLLAHGQFEHDMLKRLGSGKVPVQVTGNGRVDLLKPGFRAYFQKQIDEIRRRYGDYVLVNTNFSTVNSIWKSVEGVTAIQIQGGFVDRNNPASMKLWDDFVASEKANQAGMLAAIRELARRRPAQKIVVRPHPAEDLACWDGVFAGLPNVAIVREGSHVPWTLACRVLLHTSCTTGFEAYVAGKAALSLVPKSGWLSDCLLSDRVNPVFSDPQEFVAAAEKILDGGDAPAAAPARVPAENYVWNCGANNGSRRIAELLTEGLPGPQPISIPPLQAVVREDALQVKFSLSAAECADTLRRVAEAVGIKETPAIQSLGDSLFLVTPARMAQKVTVAPPRPDYAQLRTAIEGACQSGNFQKAYDTFKQNFDLAQRHADLGFFTGVALFELGKHALALQYLQNAALVAGGALDANVSFWIARSYHRLGDLEMALRYAEQAYRQVPMQQGFFDLCKELALRLNKHVPEHWIVIGCSHVRYFRYMQVNQPRFFGGRVHLDCYEFGGATAYGLGNPSSQAGALSATRQIRPRIAQADRVLVQFGEVDCRRAAWKAAAVSGHSIEQAIGESAAQLENYVRAEVLPHNKTVLLLGAKPQIVGDEDFYRNSLDDERIVFKPIEERERVTVSFNAQLREAARKLKVDYADLHHVMADEKSRRQFFKKVYWDGYTTDTHGNVDYLATLYFERLQEFAPAT